MQTTQALPLLWKLKEPQCFNARSVEKHNLRYTVVISDGDAKTISRKIASMPMALISRFR